MKKIIFLLVLFYSMSFGQVWNNTVTTNINEPYLEKMDLFTNATGNHILIKRTNGSIVYYRLNSQGQLMTSTNPTPFSTSGDFPSITGSNDQVYALYKEGNFIKGKYSTNGGDSWINLPNNITTTANLCNGIDAVWNDQGVHLVWATRDSYQDYETHYYRLKTNTTPFQWVDYKNVTDHSSGQYGGFPTVTVSDNRVHVSFNTGHSDDPETNIGEAKSRDKYLNDWQTPQMVYDEGSFREKIQSGSIKLFDFYYKLITGMGQYHADLHVKSRDFNATEWSGDTFLHSFASVNNIISSVNSINGQTHIVYSGAGSVVYRNYNGSSWSTENTIAEDGWFSPIISNTSNDLFVIYKSDNSGYIKYRQYDSNPLAPQNLNVTNNANNNPVISWIANTEADLKEYRVYKKLTTSSGTQTTYITTSSNSCTDTDFIITSPRLATDEVEYWVVAVDMNNHFSPESSHIVKTGQSLIQWKKALENEVSSILKDYRLEQNYPNPFNPSTTISFTVPSSTEYYSVQQNVSLKVYDILGNEVATLVNENKPAGVYNVQFAMNNFPSGVYFYTLKAGSFTETKKMLLMK